MRTKKDYNLIYQRRGNLKINRVWFPFNKDRWFNKTFVFKDKTVLDFGSNLESKIYEKSLKENATYYGFDIDRQTIKWLKKQKIFFDFYNESSIKFNFIIADNVYEHLTEKEKESFLIRAYNLLKKGGILIIIYPYFFNLNGFEYFRDRTHLQPPTGKDEALFTQMFGFRTECYLVGLPKNWVINIFNLLLKFAPHEVVYLVCKK